MKVTNDYGNLHYDSDDKRCRLITANDGQSHYGFLQCLDLGNPGNRLKTPGKKRYWGRFNPDQPEQSIKAIMGQGGKWPALPGVRFY